MAKNQKLKTIHISVFSADLKLIGFQNRRELHLSCGLINIARGNCNILLRPESNDIKGEIFISSERPVMSAELSVPPILFDQVQSSLKNNVGRPLQLIILLDRGLMVDNQGVLTITDSINAKIKDLSWILPVR
tara:strand:- start:225 stop:623 length:399 start_codon:yes stop_codon:yes gene_type:complete